MKYFDKDFISKYLDTDLDVKVFVDKTVYTVTSKSDLKPKYGMGSDSSGEMYKFMYKDITKIKAGRFTYTIDQLNDDGVETDGKTVDRLNLESSGGRYSHINFKPPESVAKAAERGLELRKKAKVKGGLSVKQAKQAGVGSGVQRAVNLKNRDVLSPATVKRMKAFFSRHAKNSKIDPGKSPEEDKGYQAFLLWGGKPGESWANKVVNQMNAADEKVKTESIKEALLFLKKIINEI